MLSHPFRDPALRTAALTTRAHRGEHPDVLSDNQRLEFLGDAVLELISSRRLFERFPDAQEGELTVMRVRLTDETALAAVARRIGLGPELRVGAGEERQGARAKDSVLSDAIEALLGAVYLDGGLEAAEAAFDRSFAPDIAALAGFGSAEPVRWERNPKGHLQTLAAARFHLEPVYAVLSREGPDHAPVFTAEVRVGDDLRATGTGSSRQKAEAAAAAALLDDPRLQGED